MSVNRKKSKHSSGVLQHKQFEKDTKMQPLKCELILPHWKSCG